MKSSLIAASSFFVAYHITYFILSITFVSFVAFIYFLLDHGLGDIEYWVEANKTFILSFAKGGSLFIFIYWASLNRGYQEQFKLFVLKEIKQIPGTRIALVSIFLSVVTIGILVQFSDPIFKIYWDQLFSMNLVRTILYYLPDVLLFCFLFDNKLLIEKSQRFFALLTSTAVSYFFSSMLFGEWLEYVFVLNFMFFYIISIYGVARINSAFVYLILNVLLGHQLLEQNQLPLLGRDFPYLSLFFLWLIATLYYTRRPA